MATKYIAPANHPTTPGSNAANGSTGTPWLTFTYAFTQMAAGDTLKVKAGTYTGESFNVNIASTSAGNPFVVEADDPNNKPLVDGQYLYPPDTDPEDDWTASDGTRGLHVPLIRITTDYCTWRNINVTRSLGRGIVINGTIADRVTNVTVEGCEVSQIRTLGVGQQDASYITIRNCNIHHTSNYIATPGVTYGNWSPALKCNDADHVIFENNVIWMTYGEGIILSFTSADCIARYNKCFDCKREKLYLQRCQRAKVYGNLCYDTQQPYISDPKPSNGIILRNEERTATEDNSTDDVLIHDNIIIACQNNIRVGGTQGGSGDFITDVRIYANTLVSAYASDGTQRAFGISSSGNYTGVVFKNNLLYQPDHKYNTVTASITGVTYGPNGYSSAIGNVPDFMEHANDIYSITLTNPDIALGQHLASHENYRPTVTYAGATIAEVTTDYEGELRASSFMGALTSDSNDPPPNASGLVKAGVSYVTVGQTAGDVDHTDATGMGGETPVAALVISSHATSAGSIAQFGRFSIGAVATNQVVQTLRMRDAVTTASNKTAGANDAIVLLKHNSSGSQFIHEEAFSQFIANGVRGTRNVAPSIDAGTIMALFGGSAIQSASGIVTCASSITGGSNTVTIALPFEPSLVFFFENVAPFDRSEGSTIRWSLGIATAANNQFSLNYFVAGTINTDVAARLSNANIAYDITNAQTHTVSTWAQNLVIETGGTTGSKQLGYLALRAVGASVYAGTFTSRTTDGSQTLSGPNFEPAIAGIFMSLVDALNTTKTDSQAGSQMVSFFTAAASQSIAWCTQDNVATTETGTLYDTKAIQIPQHDQTTGITATLTSMGGTGPVLDYTEELGSARYGIYWCIQAQNVNNIIKRVPETLSWIDATTRRKTMWRVVSEVTNWVEAAIRTRGIARIINESLTWVETKVRQAGRAKVISESLTWVEGTIPHRKLYRVISEVLQWYEVVIPRRGLAKIINESLTWVESRLFKKVLLYIITESVNWLEGIIPQRTMSRIASETVWWGESARRVLGLNKIINESLTWVEARNYVMNFMVIRSVIRLAGSFVTLIQNLKAKL